MPSPRPLINGTIEDQIRVWTFWNEQLRGCLLRAMLPLSDDTQTEAGTDPRALHLSLAAPMDMPSEDLDLAQLALGVRISDAARFFNCERVTIYHGIHAGHITPLYPWSQEHAPHVRLVEVRSWLSWCGQHRNRNSPRKRRGSRADRDSRNNQDSQANAEEAA